MSHSLFLYVIIVRTGTLVSTAVASSPISSTGEIALQYHLVENEEMPLPLAGMIGTPIPELEVPLSVSVMDSYPGKDIKARLRDEKI